MKKIQSTCNLCALACNVDFHVEDGKIVKVSPTVDYPVNKGLFLALTLVCCLSKLNPFIQQNPLFTG